MRLLLVAMLVGLGMFVGADTAVAPGVNVQCSVGVIVLTDSGASPPGSGGSTGPTPPCTVTPIP